MFKRFAASMRRFMYGRYGTDQLNMALLIVAEIVSLVNGILSYVLKGQSVAAGVVWLSLSGLMYVLLGLVIYRTLSRNIYKRQRENRCFRNIWVRLTDRNNRYFNCPNCKQTIRVPRHRGKINIRCPKCGEKFIRKT